MAKVGILKNREFDKFEKELRAIEKMKTVMRGDDYFDAQGIKTGDKLLGLDQLRKFAHGRTKQRLRLFQHGKEKLFKKRTLRAYKKRLERLIDRTAGGMTLKKLLLGMDRKKSKTTDTDNPIYGTSRKDRIRDIGKVQFEKMLGNIAHLRVSASGMTKGAPTHYKFQVQFPEWSRARARWGGLRAVAHVIQKPVLIHCTCEDYKYTYGFVADSAGYAIESEQSYPKVRNPKLQNTMCKHGGRVAEALQKGEFSLKEYLTNTINSQSRNKQAIDAELWAQPEKSKKTKIGKKQAKFKKEVERKAKGVSASDKARKKKEKTKEYKDFTKREKSNLFKKLPEIVKKATSSKKTVDKIVEGYAKKAKVDPVKAKRFAKTGIADIMTGVAETMKRQQRAVQKAVSSRKKPASVRKAQKAGDEIAENAKVRSALRSAQEFRDDPDLYGMTIKHISKKYGKPVSELKKLAGE